MMQRLLILIAGLLVAGCATTGQRANLDPRDPYESFNRGVWDFNQGADKVIIKPATTVYRAVTPVPARRGISRVFANLLEPLHFINNLLQGKPRRAVNALGRFVVNTTIGVGGLADHATDLGLPDTSEDFGQTFAVWGARKSPYLVLPILGPSTVRDAAGTAVQFAVDPLPIALDEIGASGEIKAGATVLRVVNARSKLIDSGVDAVLETSADSYATARDAYFQQREVAITDRAAVAADQLSPEEQERLLNEALDSNPATADPNLVPMPEAEFGPEATGPESEAPVEPGDDLALTALLLPVVPHEDERLAGIDY